MKIGLFVIFAILGTLLFPVQSFAQTPECLFGNVDTPVSDKLAKDFAVKAFVEKHPDSSKRIATENGMPINQLVLYFENNEYKETLKIRFSVDSSGCHVPTIYDYSYDDGNIAPVVRNYSSNFTEVVTLIKAENKTIMDFYPENCSFVDLDVSLTSGEHYGVCKSSSSNQVTVLVDSDSGGTIEMDIPITLLYSLSSTDCKPTGDFAVVVGREEVKYEISPTSKGNLVKVEYPEGFHHIDVLGFIILPSPSPAQYCGIVDGYVDKKYLAPLDQIDHGMKPESVKCNDNLVLVQKYDDSPACVTEFTKQKLIERGWITKVNLDGASSRMCYVEPDPGPCKAAIEKYYFDWETGGCKSFTWGGCNGKVPFDTMGLCQGLCGVNDEN